MIFAYEENHATSYWGLLLEHRKSTLNLVKSCNKTLFKEKKQSNPLKQIKGVSRKEKSQ